jgi:glycosyltransferase involved in cell wall biosynthesis
LSTATSPLPPLRVLTIAHNAVAASNRRRQEMLAALPGLEVTLLTPPWWDEEGRRIQAAPGGPAWWRVGRTVMTGNGTRHLYVDGLVQAIRAARPDVIDLYEEPFSLVALQTLLLREVLAPRAALVFYSAVNVWRQWRWPYRAIERLLLARADGAHAPNRDVPRILRAKGFSRQPIATVPLGVDAERFAAPLPDALPQLPRPRVGFVGRLEPVKGLDVLLDAFQFHLETRPAALVIAGEGSERARLASRMAASDTTRHAKVLPSVIYDQMPAFLRSLDVLVLPSVTILPLHREQFGRVLVEAMAAGVPVIGSSSGAIPETIGDAGLVVPERDPLALAQAIDRVLREPDLRATLVQRGLRRVRESFAWPVVAEQTAGLLRSAVAYRRRGQAWQQVVVEA